MIEQPTQAAHHRASITKKKREQFVFDVLLVLILLIAATLRLTGIDWGETTFLHPDEGFLTNVETSLVPVQNFSEYWDTDNSLLNPHNTGYTFFVYGTLPIFLVRYAATWLGQTGYGEIMLVGRQISALSDVLLVLVVYLTTARVYDRRAAILAAAFSAFTVMQVQLSHFFAVDTFLALFTMVAIYFAVRLATEGGKAESTPFRPRWFIFFGIALGMAVASKVSTVPVAVVLPLAVGVRLSRYKRGEWIDAALTAAGYLLLAAFVSLVTFRIFQPYAFSGPGFFGLRPNPLWIDNLQELLNQQTGDFDWPPSIQWARRPIWFSFKNMVLWGMGVPMALMAWGGFLAAGWQMLKGAWRKHLVLWVWTALYFGWQSLAFNPTMRYQIPVYPTLAVFAGWAVVRLWDWAAARNRLRRWWRGGTALVGGGALLLTAFWGLAFTQIYVEPTTRIAASYWIYENVPAPFNLQLEGEGGVFSHPLGFTYDQYVSDNAMYFSSFLANESGIVEKIRYKNLFTQDQERMVTLQVSEGDGLEFPLMMMDQSVSFTAGGGTESVSFNADPPPILAAGRPYLLRLSVLPNQGGVEVVSGQIRLNGSTGVITLPILRDPETISADQLSYEYSFVPAETLSLMDLAFDLRPVETQAIPQQTFRFTLGDMPDFRGSTASAEVVVDGLEDGSNLEGGEFTLDQPMVIEAGNIYYFQVENLTHGGSIRFSGAAMANEGAWDLALPLSVGGFSGYNGFYPRGLEFNMYTEATPEKLDRFLNILGESEYLTISSSRVWANTPRIPERFPLNVLYYRHLLGCPEEQTIEWCYNVAEPGMFEGDLGFELVKTFQSDPNLLGIRINDQFSEEAFTVYDHPKVFIFQKTPDYDQARAAAILGAVDFDQVIHLTPKQAGEFKSLLLPEADRGRQEEAGTWANLFTSQAWYNRSGLGAVIVWYLALSLLGWAVFPLVRRALPGLPDTGYPLARTAAMLLLAYFSWLAGSLGLTYSRGTIWVVGLVLVALGIWQSVVQRDWILRTLRERWREILRAELVFLAAFTLVLLVRFGNPDLWHPFKGGEKPMDFAYFNAILKSISFPAYDPWYAGGYINYYYFGFVFVGTLVKMLGIVPALAYNLVLPTVFAMIASGAYSAGWNLYQVWLANLELEQPGKGLRKLPAWIIGVSAALGTALLGNLGTVKLILEGLQRMAASGDFDSTAGLLTKLGWTLRGAGQMLSGNGLQFGIADYYWYPSRVIPAVNEPEPITEFPWFTTIYADLHAHYMALALVFLALAWALSVVISKAWNNTSRWQVVWSLVFAGIAIGSLRATNTWDLPTYLALAVLAVVYAMMKYGTPLGSLDKQFPPWLAKIIQAAGAVTALSLLSFLSFQPYAQSYSLPYSEISLWRGTHTPLTSYFFHWGLFLFVLVFWMGRETRQWMASTPLSHVRKLEPYQIYIWVSGILLLVVMVFLAAFLKVRIHLVAIPLALWAGVLLFRPGIGDGKRMVLFMTGTALFLTILVEVIVLSGDIGRMNTVFKFYLQAWVLFAVSSATALGWTLYELKWWRPVWQTIWQLGMIALVAAAFMFPLTATPAKIRDRMSPEAPHTLDGMAFMKTSTYPDEGGVVDLAEDYRAIRWMQENVPGTPVIVEANTPLYRWGSRFSIYTGLPGVLGWDWHQTQQRGFSPVSEIPERKREIELFYTLQDAEFAHEFIREYDVAYIIVGQLERNYYNGPGLLLFEQFAGKLWEEVYRDGQTVIYRVLKEGIN